MCPGVDQTRRVQELRVREDPASWGREERLRCRGLELGFQEEGQDGFGMG